MDLNERKNRILHAIIRIYMKTGEPVGSKVLLETENLGLSSATVRNEMSDLEQMGLLTKPHTSAGRIPSQEGYRYYINSIATYRLTKKDQAWLDACFGKPLHYMELMPLISEHLAEFTGCPVFAVSPRSTDGIFTFELLPAGKKTLAIMAIASGGTVRQFAYRTSCETNSEDAARLTKIFNTVLSGFPIEQIKDVRMMLLTHELRKTCPQYLGIEDAVRNMLSQLRSYDLNIGGSSKLLGYPEFADIAIARKFIDVLGRQERLLEALLEDASEDGINVRIGEENNILPAPNASILSVTSTTRFPLILATIGPSRMDYAKAIAGFRHMATRLQNIEF